MLKRACKKASQTDAPPEQTDVRFGMRGLLATTAVVAVASAALGPFFRDLTPGRRGEVATAWCIALAVVLALVGYHARNRLRLERQAGRRLFSLTSRAKMGFQVRPWLVVFGGLISIGVGLYYLAMIARIFGSARNNPAPLVEHLFPCLVGAALISMGIVTIWWNRTVQLRENGVLRGLKLLRWTHVTAHRWNDSDLFLEGVDQRHRDWQLTVVRRVEEAGAPLVRLPMQTDWPSLLVALLLAIGCYYIIQQFFLFPPTLVAGVLGIGSGLGAAAVIDMVLREKFDLCENGVVLVRWPLLPWARIRVLKWDRDGRGALLLRSGWRRIKGKAPAEHREVVDRVLREKVTANRVASQKTSSGN